VPVEIGVIEDEIVLIDETAPDFGVDGIGRGLRAIECGRGAENSRELRGQCERGRLPEEMTPGGLHED